MNKLECDLCGCFLYPEQWKECDKCTDKDRARHKQRFEEVLEYETESHND